MRTCPSVAILTQAPKACSAAGRPSAEGKPSVAGVPSAPWASAGRPSVTPAGPNTSTKERPPPVCLRNVLLDWVPSPDSRDSRGSRDSRDETSARAFIRTSLRLRRFHPQRAGWRG